MDWNMLAGIGAILAVGVAIWSVIVAHRANDRADESNEIAKNSLKVAREAHELNKRLAPPAWSLAEVIDDTTVRFRNQSGRHLVVTSLTVDPNSVAQYVSASERPFRVENGDAFAVGFSYTYASSTARRLSIGWRPEDDESDEQVTERSL